MQQRNKGDVVMKMWEGRFSKALDEHINAFNSSIGFDARMYQEDIQGSIAHATMLAAVGIITSDDKEAIVTGLQLIAEDIESGVLAFDSQSEDIHMFIEEVLTKRIGNPGKKLHTARSRNDQVATDLRLYIRNESKALKQQLVELITVLCDVASQQTETIMPCYTHLQRAQPITFAHHLMAYVEMFSRDLSRVEDWFTRMNYNPLGSGAAAGTTYPINRVMTSELLDFTGGATKNSIDGVSDRDFCLEYSSLLAIIMVHLSRFSEEIIMWCSWEFRFVELDDSFATGSSIMPQKKNPDIAELVRGKSGRVIGDVMSLLTMMKGMPLAYNKDMQEDKEAIFDAIDTVKLCLNAFIPMLGTLTPLKENMRKAAANGFINATDCADYLTKKGMPFREAYKIVGKLVAYCLVTDKTLETLTLAEYTEASLLFSEDIYEAIDLEQCVKRRTSFGGPAPDVVKEHIATVQKIMMKEKELMV